MRRIEHRLCHTSRSGCERLRLPARWGLGLLAFGLVATLPVMGQETDNAPVQQTPSADTILINGRIFTADAFSSTVEAVAIADGKFLVVGSNEAVRAATGPATKVIDLKGRMAMPGITDMHIHPVRGGLAERTYCKFSESAPID